MIWHDNEYILSYDDIMNKNNLSYISLSLYSSQLLLLHASKLFGRLMILELVYSYSFIDAYLFGSCQTRWDLYTTYIFLAFNTELDHLLVYFEIYYPGILGIFSQHFFNIKFMWSKARWCWSYMVDKM